ncbi:MAG TPA: sulfate/thiosulfate ABC transporter permease CysW, partial [Candidatus Paceibacterota bacterium]|nr:sulfate/thiosulfate ABC transporter permease CysW [Candidatus Paceibacterota bacterium]
MNASVPVNTRGRRITIPRASEEVPWVKWLLIAVSTLFLTVFLLLPLANVFAQAFGKGWRFYLDALREPHTWAAIRLTLTVTAITVPLNLTFGLAAAWAI